MSAFNGAGTFVISGVGLPYITGTTISSTVANQLNSDLAAGLSNCITKDGQTTVTNNIPMNGFKITGLGVATAPGDALSYGNPATVSNLNVTGNFTVSGSSVGISNANLIENGDFRVNQRYDTNILTLPATGPISDRWGGVVSVGGKLNFQTFNAGSALAGQKLTSFLQVSVGVAYVPAAGEVFSIRQAIEGINCTELFWGFATARPITLSFQMYTNTAGLYTGVIRNSANNRTYVWSYNNTTPNVWTNVVIIIPGDIVGTWLLNTGVGLYLEIVLAAGSGVVQPPGAWYGVGLYGGTGQVNMLATVANAASFTAVKIEVGAVATPFVPDDYAVSFLKCRRYIKMFRGPASAGAPYAFFPAEFISIAGNQAVGNFVLGGEPMRAPPALQIAGSFQLSNGTSGFAVNNNAISLSNINPYGFSWQVGSAVALPGAGSPLHMGANNDTGAYIAADAEL